MKEENVSYGDNTLMESEEKNFKLLGVKVGK